MKNTNYSHVCVCVFQVCGDKVLINSLCKWDHLPKQGFPMMFHGVKGKDEREGNSPSFFNAQEVR